MRDNDFFYNPQELINNLNQLSLEKFTLPFGASVNVRLTFVDEPVNLTLFFSNFSTSSF